MTECKDEQITKDGVWTLLTELLSRRKVISHQPHGELLFLQWKRVLGAQTIEWSQLSFYSNILTPVSQQFSLQKEIWVKNVWDKHFFHLPKHSKFINGGFVSVMRRASPTMGARLQFPTQSASCSTSHPAFHRFPTPLAAQRVDDLDTKPQRAPLSKSRGW